VVKAGGGGGLDGSENGALISELSVERSGLGGRGRATTSLPVTGHTRSPSR
jgi:hypothetical protein